MHEHRGVAIERVLGILLLIYLFTGSHTANAGSFLFQPPDVLAHHQLVAQHGVKPVANSLGEALTGTVYVEIGELLWCTFGGRQGVSDGRVQ